MKSVATFVRAINSGIPSGWSINSLSSGTDSPLRNSYSESPYLAHLVLSHFRYPNLPIDIFHIERAKNISSGALTFDWNNPREDHTVCLLWNSHFMILAIPRAIPHWEHWVEDLQKVLKSKAAEQDAAANP